jgi:hypothetical protein
MLPLFRSISTLSFLLHPLFPGRCCHLRIITHNYPSKQGCPKNWLASIQLYNHSVTTAALACSTLLGPQALAQTLWLSVCHSTIWHWRSFFSSFFQPWDPLCKSTERVCVGATLGTETRQNARPHVLVFIFCFFSLFLLASFILYCLVLDNKMPIKSRHKTKTIYASQSRSFPPSPPLCLYLTFFSIALVSRSRKTLTDTKTAATR